MSMIDLNENGFGGGIDEWLPRSWGDFMSSPETSMEHPVAGSIVAASSSPQPIEKTCEVYPQFPNLTDHQNEAKKQPKKRMVRPKLAFGNGVSAKERRKTQVRLAQQAYRQRKEGYAKSLQKENEDLKSRLSKVRISFGKLLAITTEANLPLQQLDIIQSLTREVEQNRLPQLLTGGTHQASEDVESRKSITSSPAGHLESSSDLIPGTGSEAYNASRSFELRYEQDSFGGPYSTVQLLKETSFSPFDQIPSVPLPFGLRLKIESLKRGYQLITSSETKFVALRRAFHRYIFSETRERILQRIYLHLNQSMKAVHAVAADNWDSNIPLDFLDPELFKTTFPPITNQELPGCTAHYSIAIADLVSKESKYESAIEGYVYPEDMSRHLLQKGLDLNTGSHFVFLSPGLGSETSKISLFDEMVAGHKLYLNVRKLLQELLNRVTCLESGPGFQQTEIDEALRITILEAV